MKLSVSTQPRVLDEFSATLQCNLRVCHLADIRGQMRTHAGNVAGACEQLG